MSGTQVVEYMSSSGCFCLRLGRLDFRENFDAPLVGVIIVLLAVWIWGLLRALSYRIVMTFVRVTLVYE